MVLFFGLLTVSEGLEAERNGRGHCDQLCALAESRMYGLQKHPPEADSHPLWQEMRVLDGQGRDQTGTVFFNAYQGSFSQTAPPPPAAVRGGILAGDTVTATDLICCSDTMFPILVISSGSRWQVSVP